ncbi:MAG: hypothetical protein ACM3VS_11090 [Candidatus Dadabacteria bacterium]
MTKVTNVTIVNIVHIIQLCKSAHYAYWNISRYIHLQVSPTAGRLHATASGVGS